MLSNLSEPIHVPFTDMLSLIDGNPVFSDYITRCRECIAKRRTDLSDSNQNLILKANTPFELTPLKSNLNTKHFKYGALLIHGLLDSPFSLLEIGQRLQKEGVLCRSILLPGHGTVPEDLMHVTYQEWIDTVSYGINTFKNQVDELFLIGYSTGAALAAYHALSSDNIAGIIMLSPAIRIKAPVHIVAAWHNFRKHISKNNKDWIHKEKEVDYAKYRSVCFNGYNQVAKLANILHEIGSKKVLSTPLLEILSEEDETISASAALKHFSKLHNPRNRLLIYGAKQKNYHDARITYRPSYYPDLRIHHFSHVAIPFSADNPHYGRHGDFIYASHSEDAIYGGYNKLEVKFLTHLKKLGLVKHLRNELTYNPDFDYMMNAIVEFILK